MEMPAKTELTSLVDSRLLGPAGEFRAQSRRSVGIVGVGIVGKVEWWVPWGVLLLALLIMSRPAYSQDSDDLDGSSPWSGVEVMIVTGTGGVSGLLTGTTSVTAFDAETLNALGADNIGDISDFTPNLEVVVAGTTSPTLFIRGVGLNDFSAVSTPAISVYQDDVPRGAPAILLGRLFDLQEVAVLRGPQGTGPYRNASAGAIRIYPRQPTGEFQAYLSGSYGNYDYVDFEGALDVPVIPDILAVRSSFAFSKRGGWMENRCSNLPAPEDRPERGGLDQPNSAPHSLCGEEVRFNPNGRNISDVPNGLPSKINDLSNWAVRSIFKFTPDLPIDTTWSLNLHYSKVRDDSHIGQQIGIQEPQPAPTPSGDPRQIVGSGPLNNAGNRSYADKDILDRLDQLRTSFRAKCPDCGPGQVVPNRGVNLASRSALARELEDLDKNPFAGAVNSVGRTRNEVYGFALRGDVDISDTVQLKSITGFEKWDRSNRSDLDFTPETLFQLNSVDRGHQVSQELRLMGELPIDAAIDWEIGGLLVVDEVEVFGTSANTPGNFGADTIRDYQQDALAWSAYAKVEWEITELFTLDGGARWNYERKQMDYFLGPTQPVIESDEDVAFDAPTGNIRLKYNATEDVSFYVMYTRGWKAGSFNATSDPSKGLTFANPERIDAYEFGMDLSAFDGRLTVTGSVFYYDYYNYQIFTAESNLSPQPEFVTINANSAEVYGAEIETFFQPFEGTNIRVNFGWLESQFLDFTQFQLTSIQDGGGQQRLFEKPIVHTGNRLLNSPEFTVAIIASQRFDLGRMGDLTFRYNGAWTDDVFFDSTEGKGIPNNDGVQVLSDDMIGEKAYWLHGIGMDWVPRNVPITVSGWVRNLTNEAYRNFSADLNTFLDTTIHFIGEPRTYGFTVRVDF